MSAIPSGSDGVLASGAPNLETLPAKRRRQYSTAYKLGILEQADACTMPGALASLLRREGLYSSTLADFRKQKARGDFETKSPQSKAGKRTAATADAQAREEIGPLKSELASLAVIERENRRLRRELERAKALLELQKKVSEILDISLEPSE